MRSHPGILRTALESPVQERPAGVSPEDREILFTRACRERTRGNGFTLKVGRFNLDIREKFFMLRVVRQHWTRLPRESVDTLLLEVFKVMLDEALNNLV